MNWADLLVYIVTGGYGIIYRWGYIGLFFISLITHVTIFFPFPNFIFIFTFGAILNPFLVGAIAALGSTIGESTAYVIGLGGKKVLEKRYSKKINKMRKTFNKYGSVLWIFILAVTPIPDDIGGLFCGIIKYDFKKYFLASLAGKLILSLILAYAGHYSLNWVLNYFQWELPS
jgi:uncharacterized membrane protein YdjX (TVP38/TMEM64 family)